MTSDNLSFLSCRKLYFQPGMSCCCIYKCMLFLVFLHALSKDTMCCTVLDQLCCSKVRITWMKDMFVVWWLQGWGGVFQEFCSRCIPSFSFRSLGFWEIGGKKRTLLILGQAAMVNFWVRSKSGFLFLCLESTQNGWILSSHRVLCIAMAGISVLILGGETVGLSSMFSKVTASVLCDLHVCIIYLTAHQDAVEIRRQKLDYEEITPCLIEVTKVWDSMLNTPARESVHFEQKQLYNCVKDGKSLYPVRHKCKNLRDHVGPRTVLSIVVSG